MTPSSPLDMPGAPAPPPRKHLPVLVVPAVARVDGEGASPADPWSWQPSALRVDAVQAGFRVAGIGVRAPGGRSTCYLTAARLRELAEHLHDVADLLDPAGALPEESR